MKIYATHSGKAFAKKIASHLGEKLHAVDIGKYPDGQIWNKIIDLPHNEIALVVGNTLGSDGLVELLTLLDTVQDFSVQKTVVVVPYFGAGRQDRANEPGQDKAGRMQMKVIACERPNRIVLIDLHNSSLKECTALDPRIRNMEPYAKTVFLDVIRSMDLTSDFVFAAADVGRLGIARSYAKEFKVGTVYLDKRREGPGQIEVMNVVGDVRGKTVIMIDDIVDSGGTVIQGARALKKEGAGDIHLFATHLVLSGRGKKRFLHLSELFTSLHGTDTIELPHPSIFQIHSIAGLIADCIQKEIL
ncbi:MAG: ribose-phosphate diphosphokinase [bacterium]|nr:ribose-phosphate diphosphokinase [bacterium]